MNRKIYYKDKFIAFTKDQIQISGNQALKKITNEPQENELREILRDFLYEKSLQSYSLASEHFEKCFLFFLDYLPQRHHSLPTVIDGSILHKPKFSTLNANATIEYYSEN